MIVTKTIANGKMDTIRKRKTQGTIDKKSIRRKKTKKVDPNIAATIVITIVIIIVTTIVITIVITVRIANDMTLVAEAVNVMKRKPNETIDRKIGIRRMRKKKNVQGPKKVIIEEVY